MDIAKETTYYIWCNRCGDVCEYSELGGGGTKKSAEKYFRNHGWRVRNGETLCQECVKKQNEKRCER